MRWAELFAHAVLTFTFVRSRSTASPCRRSSVLRRSTRHAALQEPQHRMGPLRECALTSILVQPPLHAPSRAHRTACSSCRSCPRGRRTRRSANPARVIGICTVHGLEPRAGILDREFVDQGVGARCAKSARSAASHRRSSPQRHLAGAFTSEIGRHDHQRVLVPVRS